MLAVISRIQNLVAIKSLQPTVVGSFYNINEQVTSVTKRFNQSPVTN